MGGIRTRIGPHILGLLSRQLFVTGIAWRVAHQLLDPNRSPRCAPATSMSARLRDDRPRVLEVIAGCVTQPACGRESYAKPGPARTSRRASRLLDYAADGADLLAPAGTHQMRASVPTRSSIELRVHGIEGLRVIDMSVVPFYYGRSNANIPTRSHDRQSGREARAAGRGGRIQRLQEYEDHTLDHTRHTTRSPTRRSAQARRTAKAGKLRAKGGSWRLRSAALSIETFAVSGTRPTSTPGIRSALRRGGRMGCRHAHEAEFALVRSPRGRAGACCGLGCRRSSAR